MNFQTLTQIASLRLSNARACGRRCLREYPAFWLALALYLTAYFADESSLHPSADGYYSWLYARSLVLDGDIHFANDYAQCGDPLHMPGPVYQGRPGNMFYAGPALAYIPLFALARVLSLAVGGYQWLSAHSCSGAWMRLWMLPGPVVGAATTALLHRVLLGSFGSRVAWLSTTAWCAGITYVAYAGIDSHYSHIHLTFWSTLAVWWTRQVHAERSAPRSLALLFVLGFIIPMCRLNAGLLLFPLVVSALQLELRARLRAIAVLAGGVLVAVLCTMGTYNYLYGSPLHIPQGRAFFNFASPHPWLLLFAPKGGLFFWSPSIWLSWVGLLIAVRGRQERSFHLSMFAVVVAAVYIDSSVADWDGSWGYGSRRQLPLWPYFAFWFARACKPLVNALPKRLPFPRVTTALAGIVTALWALNSLLAALLTSCATQPSQRDLYGRIPPFGACWALLDSYGVDLSLLPAHAYFSLRYGLGLRAYRQAIHPRFRGPVATNNEGSLVFDSEELCLPTSGGICAATAGAPSKHGHIILTTMHAPVRAILLKLRESESPPISLVVSEDSQNQQCGVAREHAGRYNLCVPLAPACAHAGMHDFVIDSNTPIHLEELQFSATADCSDPSSEAGAAGAPTR